MADTTTASAAPWSASTDASRSPPAKFSWNRLLPFVGPVALFIVWDLVVRAGLIKVILLPTPLDTSVEALHGFVPATVVIDVSLMIQPLNRSGSTTTFFSKMPLSENRS